MNNHLKEAADLLLAPHQDFRAAVEPMLQHLLEDMLPDSPAAAATVLGQLYERGVIGLDEECKPNIQQAALHYWKAYEQGSGEAAYRLSELTEVGKSPEQEGGEFAYWIESDEDRQWFLLKAADAEATAHLLLRIQAELRRRFGVEQASPSVAMR